MERTRSFHAVVVYQWGLSTPFFLSAQCAMDGLLPPKVRTTVPRCRQSYMTQYCMYVCMYVMVGLRYSRRRRKTG